MNKLINIDKIVSSISYSINLKIMSILLTKKVLPSQKIQKNEKLHEINVKHSIPLKKNRVTVRRSSYYPSAFCCIYLFNGTHGSRERLVLLYISSLKPFLGHELCSSFLLHISFTSQCVSFSFYLTFFLYREQ